MTVSGKVTYTLSTLRRAGFVGGGKQLLLTTVEDPQEALTAFHEAILEANDAMEGRIDEELFGVVNGPVLTPQGPMAHVAECEPARALPVLLELIVAGLERRGVSGRLRPGGTASPPVFDNTSFPALGLLLQGPVDLVADAASFGQPGATPRVGAGSWAEHPPDPALVEDAVRWVLAVDGPVFLRIGPTQITLAPDAVMAAVTAALPRERRLGVQRVTHDSGRRSVRVTPAGLLVDSYDPSLPREDHLEALLDLTTSVAERIVTGLVRESHTSVSQLQQFFHFPPSAPLARSAGVTLLRHLEPAFVYDAGVAQVLTGEQLGHTHDLSPARWRVAELGHDRHLVRHREPGRWFNRASSLPHDAAGWGAFVDAEVVAQARADFGEALMTAETLDAHPGPLSGEYLDLAARYLRRPD